jgi:hypothetical protein
MGQDDDAVEAMTRLLPVLLLLLLLPLCEITVAATPSIPGPVGPAAVPGQSYHQAPIVPIVCWPPWLGPSHECFQILFNCRDVEGLHCCNIYLRVHGVGAQSALW